MGDLIDIGASGLADGREGVNGRDALSEEGVGGLFRFVEGQRMQMNEREERRTHKLGKLRRPKTGGNDLLSRDPVGVDLHERRLSSLSLGRSKGSNEDTIGGTKVGNSGTLGEELGVGENVETKSRARVGFEDGAHRGGGAAGDGGFLDDDFGGGGDRGDATGAELDVAFRLERGQRAAERSKARR